MDDDLSGPVAGGMGALIGVALASAAIELIAGAVKLIGAVLLVLATFALSGCEALQALQNWSN